MIVRPADIYAAGFCADGARNWFAAHGLSWADFVRDGASAESLLATGDALALRVVEAAQHKGG